jgi:hypothetical protein
MSLGGPRSWTYQLFASRVSDERRFSLTVQYGISGAWVSRSIVTWRRNVQLQTNQTTLHNQVRFRGIGALSADGNVRPLLSVSLKLTNRGTFWLVAYLTGPPVPRGSPRLLLPEWLSSCQFSSSAAVTLRLCRSCRSIDALSSSKSSSRSSPSAVS